MENQRAVPLVFVVGGVLIGLLVRSATRAVMGAMVWEDPSIGGVVTLSVLVGLASAVVAFFVLLRHKKASSFTDEVASELTRVTWPGRDETVNNTLIVVAATIFFSLLLSSYDFIWAKVTETFLYTSG